jgi:hypothetical protein
MIVIDGCIVGASEVVRQLQDDEISALDVKIALKQMEVAIEQVKKVADRMAADEAAKYGEKSFVYKGAKIELAELASRYDFSKCGYPQLTRMEDAIKSYGEQSKSLQAWLKSLKGKTEYIDPETGEVCEVYPPTKTSTTGIKITLAK